MGAYLNVKINAVNVQDSGFTREMMQQASEIVKNAATAEADILNVVNEKI
jgi:formiminotetrahydrofolate cyclodeaminase